MRLATFNVLHGLSLDDGRVDLGRFAAAVRQLDADILALQEVDRDQQRSHRADLTAVAAAAMGARTSRFAAALVGTPGASWVPATGTDPEGAPTYGVALLSRYPGQQWQTLRMPSIPVRVPMRQPARRRIVMVCEEPRVALVGSLRTPLGSLTAVSTHLAFVPGWSRVQLRRLVRNLSTSPDPLVLMGDLNMSGDRPAAITGYRSLGVAGTFPAGRPDRQLDHILLRGAPAAASSAHAVRLPLSDHCALVVDIERLGSDG